MGRGQRVGVKDLFFVCFYFPKKKKKEKKGVGLFFKNCLGYLFKCVLFWFFLFCFFKRFLNNTCASAGLRVEVQAGTSPPPSALTRAPSRKHYPPSGGRAGGGGSRHLA